MLFAFKMYKVRLVLVFLILSTICFLQIYYPRLKTTIRGLRENDIFNSSQKEEMNLRYQSREIETLLDISTSKVKNIKTNETSTLGTREK